MHPPPIDSAADILRLRGPFPMLESTRFADLGTTDGRLAASKSKVALRTLSFHNRNRPTKWFTCLAVLCFVCVLLSTTVQATHFCGLRGLETQTAVELDQDHFGQSCLPHLPYGSVHERSDSAGCILCHGQQHAVCRRPADAPETRPEFFPALYSPSSASPGLGRFPICNFPFFWRGLFLAFKEHDTNAAACGCSGILNISAPRFSASWSHGHAFIRPAKTRLARDFVPPAAGSGRRAKYDADQSGPGH